MIQIKCNYIIYNKKIRFEIYLVVFIVSFFILLHPIILFMTFGALIVNYLVEKYDILYRCRISNELSNINQNQFKFLSFFINRYLVQPANDRLIRLASSNSILWKSVF